MKVIRNMYVINRLFVILWLKTATNFLANFNQLKSWRKILFDMTDLETKVHSWLERKILLCWNIHWPKLPIELQGKCGKLFSQFLNVTLQCNYFHIFFKKVFFRNLQKLYVPVQPELSWVAQLWKHFYVLRKWASFASSWTEFCLKNRPLESFLWKLHFGRTFLASDNGAKFIQKIETTFVCQW
jgi:hypothetical protein